MLKLAYHRALKLLMMFSVMSLAVVIAYTVAINCFNLEIPKMEYHYKDW